MNRIVTYYNAPCGSGKTELIVSDLIPTLLREDRSVILAAPTHDVITETQRRLLATGCSLPIHPIHAGTGDGAVTTRLMHAVGRYRMQEPHTLMITHKALLDRLPLANYAEFDLIIDETFGAHSYHVGGSPSTFHSITDNVRIVDAGPRYGRLDVIDEGALRRLAEEDVGDDDRQRGLPSLATALLHPHWDIYVDVAAYEALLKGRKKQQKLVAHGLLRTSVIEDFRSVSILGAAFTHTGLYRLWSNQRVCFQPANDLEARLRYVQHPNSNLITIEYGFNESYSKTLRDQHDNAAWKAMTNHLSSGWKGERFAWIANKDIDKKVTISEFSDRLPNFPHGLNSYSSYNRVACLSALNAPESHVGFLAQQGMSREDVSEDTYMTAIYQAACRISIRDPNNTNPKTIFVPDHRSAMWLRHNHFPDATLSYLGLDNLEGCQKGKKGRPRQHSDSRERCRSSRNNQSDRIAYYNSELDNLRMQNEDSLSVFRINNGCNKNLLYKDNDCSGMRSHGTLWRAIDSHEVPMVFDGLAHTDLIRILKQQWKCVTSQKEHNYLICPSRFDGDETGYASRKIEHIKSVNGIWLDFENGELSHKDFSELFPALRIVVFNTYSNTIKGNRWRAYMPISEPVTAEIYKLFTHAIRDRLLSAGYVEKASQRKSHDQRTSGLDTSKLHAASAFYMPCQAVQREASFFKDYKQKGRSPLDVGQWIRDCSATRQEPSFAPYAIQERSGIDQAKVDAAIARWRDVGCQKGEGDQEMLMLFHALWDAGMRGIELLQTLEWQARYAFTPKDRIRQARRLCKENR